MQLHWFRQGWTPVSARYQGKTDVVCRKAFVFNFTALIEIPSQHLTSFQGDNIWELKGNIRAKSTFDIILEWKLILNLNYNNCGAILVALLNLHKTKRLNFVYIDFWN